MTLHEFHARRVESTLGLAEASLERMEHLLARRGQDGVVRRVEDTLPPGLRSSMLDQVRWLRRFLAEMARSLSIEGRSMDVRQVLGAEISTLWVMFEDCRPARMKGYGQAFDPETRATLESYVEQVLEAILALRAAVE